jgi:hypothetical protein
MSKGIVHHEYYKKSWPFVPFIAVGASGLSYYFMKNPLFSLLLLCSIPLGYWIGNYIDPDFDLISITYGEGRMMRQLGILGKILFVFWMPYAFICQIFGHRSVFSHWPVISTFFRLLYFFIPFWIALFYWKWDIWDWEIVIFIGLLIGLSIADSVHWFLDIFPKEE